MKLNYSRSVASLAFGLLSVGVSHLVSTGGGIAEAQEMTADQDMTNCKKIEVDFVISETDDEMLAVEEYIKEDLAKIGIVVNTVALPSDDFGVAMRNGTFHMMFGRSWGAPYDPHSYMSSWQGPSYEEYTATASMQEPFTQSRMLELIQEASRQSDPTETGRLWKEILEGVHSQATFAPLWGTRVPTVANRRLDGIEPGPQAYSYPLDSVRIKEGSTTVTIAPGHYSELFQKVGPLTPHQYNPNAMFAQAWIYEGLVGYGQDGEILPMLASSWTKESSSDGDGEVYTFSLRENVTFHDGTAWNCSVAKLNFDHILETTAIERHQGATNPKNIKSWTCNEKGQFVIETYEVYYPLLQDFSFIRPFVFASATAFANGLDTNPTTQNLCTEGVDNMGSWDFIAETVTCGEMTAPIGTGPFVYDSRIARDPENPADGEAEVTFTRNDAYWGRLTDIEVLKMVHFESAEDVEAALLAGELDIAAGAGPLTFNMVNNFKLYHNENFTVRHTDILQHGILSLNTGRAPTDDLVVRQAIIHAINKGRIVEAEFSNLVPPVEQLFPQTAPFCNVNLNPQWSYDFEKAFLLNCPAPLESSKLTGGAIGGIVAVCVAAVLASLFVCVLVHKEKQGDPMFVTDQKNLPEPA